MIWKANPKIVALLEERGALFAKARSCAQLHALLAPQDADHFCARRVQWFAGMDEVPGYNGAKPAEPLRATALRGVEATQFYPAWGQARLHGMIANRPDWTLSRQRQWGVPMPFFISQGNRRVCIRARSNCWKRSRSASSRAASRRGRR